MNTEQVRAMAESLLTSETGITEQSWELVRELLIEHGIYEEFQSIVDATDGWFYIPVSHYVMNSEELARIYAEENVAKRWQAIIEEAFAYADTSQVTKDGTKRLRLIAIDVRKDIQMTDKKLSEEENMRIYRRFFAD